MTFQEAVALVEGYYPNAVDGLPTSISQTGEPYTVVKSDIYENEASAIRHWLAEFQHYAATKSGKLYWRVRPELLIQEAAAGPRYYKVYSRLLISDEQIIYPDLNALDRAEEIV